MLPDGELLEEPLEEVVFVLEGLAELLAVEDVDFVLEALPELLFVVEGELVPVTEDVGLADDIDDTIADAEIVPVPLPVGVLDRRGLIDALADLETDLEASEDLVTEADGLAVSEPYALGDAEADEELVSLILEVFVEVLVEVTVRVEVTVLVFEADSLGGLPPDDRAVLETLGVFVEVKETTEVFVGVLLSVE